MSPRRVERHGFEGQNPAVITVSPTLTYLASWLGRYPSLATAVGKIAPRLTRLRGNLRLADAAVKSWVLGPAESAVIRPAIYDEEDLARVTGVDGDSSREIEWRRIQGGALEYRSSIAYQLRDAVLSKGHVILPGHVRRVTTQASPWWGRYTEVEREPALLTATLNSSRYFGHWMMDELTRILAAPHLGKPVAPPRPLSAHQKDYLEILGLTQHERSDVLFQHLVITDDRTQNSYRRERYAILRARAQRGRRAAPGEGVMLLRRQTGVARILINEEELAEKLAQQGFRTLCPTEHSVAEILDACMDARIVVGVEGSQMIHALLVMRDRGTLVTLQPPYRFNNILKTYCDGLALQYAFLVGHQRENGFYVDPEKMMRLLDRLPGT